MIKTCAPEHQTSRNGFTLVELSIVFVVIGLLIGGVIAGRSLVKSAQINSQVAQFQQFDAAATNFYTQFQQIPGDSDRVKAMSSAPYRSTNMGGFPGLYGDADGVLETWTNETGCTSQLMYGEQSYFWAQLGLGGIGYLKETYNNMQLVASPWFDLKFGNNGTAPLSKFDDTGIIVGGTRYGGVFYLLGLKEAQGAEGVWPLGKGVPVDALKALDTKMDDGMPTTGGIRVVLGSTFSYSCGTLTADNVSYLPWSPLSTGVCFSGADYSSSQTALCNISVKANISK